MIRGNAVSPKRKIRQSCQRSRLQHLGARPEFGKFHGLELPVVDSMAWPCSQQSPSLKSIGFRGFFTHKMKKIEGQAKVAVVKMPVRHQDGAIYFL